MAETIKIVKKEKQEPGKFMLMSKPGFQRLISKTSKKNVIILYVLLAGNKNDFIVNLRPASLVGLVNIPENLAKELTRSSTIQELRDLGYINDKGEFNEDGWGDIETSAEDSKIIEEDLETETKAPEPAPAIFFDF